MSISSEYFRKKDGNFPAIADDGWQMGCFLNLRDMHFLVDAYNSVSTMICAKLDKDCLVVGSNQYYLPSPEEGIYVNDFRYASPANGGYFVTQTLYPIATENGETFYDIEKGITLSYALNKGRENECFEFSIYGGEEKSDSTLKGKTFVAIFGDNENYQIAHERFASFLEERKNY